MRRAPCTPAHSPQTPAGGRPLPPGRGRPRFPHRTAGQGLLLGGVGSALRRASRLRPPVQHVVALRERGEGAWWCVGVPGGRGGGWLSPHEAPTALWHATVREHVANPALPQPSHHSPRMTPPLPETCLVHMVVHLRLGAHAVPVHRLVKAPLSGGFAQSLAEGGVGGVGDWARGCRWVGRRSRANAGWAAVERVQRGWRGVPLTPAQT